MNDERLTKRLANGAVEYESKGYIHRLYPQNIDCYSTEQRMILRLAELEYKIENGTLVEFPRIIRPNTIEWLVQYQFGSGMIGYNTFYSESEAEARLKELQEK